LKLVITCKDGEQRPWLCPDLLRGSQLVDIITGSRDDELPEEISAAWEDDALTDYGRVVGVRVARMRQKYTILVWFLRHPRFPTEAVQLRFRGIMGMGPYYDNFILRCFDRRKRAVAASTEVLAAAISRGVPFENMQRLLYYLLKFGGPAMAYTALRQGYQLQFPQEMKFIRLYLPYLDRAFLARCEAYSIVTNLVRIALAGKTKDLGLLEAVPPDTWLDNRFVAGLMREAIMGGWRPGLEVIAKWWSPDAHYSLRHARRDLEVVHRSGGPPDTDCWDVLLRLGRPWPDAAFFFGFSHGDLALVERALRWGAIRHSQAHCFWCRLVPRVLNQAELSMRPLRLRSASERRVIYIAALVDPEVAQAMAPDVDLWNKAVQSLLSWWGSLARAHAPTHGAHVSEVVETMLAGAGFDLPKVWKQVEPVAAVIRDRLRMRGPIS
jgi:hypothetical protein